MKRSSGKATWPGRKQVWRLPARDVIALEDEHGPEGATPLLEPVMRAGARVSPRVPLSQIREGCRTMVSALPSSLLDLDNDATYPVDPSPQLAQLLAE